MHDESSCTFEPKTGNPFCEEDSLFLFCFPFCVRVSLSTFAIFKTSHMLPMLPFLNKGGQVMSGEKMDVILVNLRA